MKAQAIAVCVFFRVQKSLIILLTNANNNVIFYSKDLNHIKTKGRLKHE